MVSLLVLTIINGVILLLYLPLGFMAWAFWAGGLANSSKDHDMAIPLIVSATPAIVFLAATILPWLIPQPAAAYIAWTPSWIVGGFVGLIMIAAMISGFVDGLRSEEE